MRVRVEGAVPDSLRDGKVATQLYRIAQEAVTNAVKHSHAQSITIQIDGEAGQSALRIVDDGLGIDQAKASDGMGLRIMRYRASSIGGRLSVARGTDGGTLVMLDGPAGAASQDRLLNRLTPLEEEDT